MQLAAAQQQGTLGVDTFGDAFGRLGRRTADALAELTQRGVRTARVVELPAPPPQTFLRVARADADLQGRLRMLGGVGSGFVPCQRRER